MIRLKRTTYSFLVAGTFALNCALLSANEHALLDFESGAPIAGNHTSHKAEVFATRDVPEGGGQWAASTFVDNAAGTTNFFGTGFQFPKTDASGAGEINLWIKTDIYSAFNLQLHSADGGVSIFPFSTVEGKVENWKQITAPITRFKKPPWAKAKADLKSINKFQVTAFGNGSYDGKTIVVDQLSAVGGPVHSPELKRKITITEPVILKRSEPINLFDGKTLNGWFATPRIYVPKGKEFANIPSDQLYEAVVNHYEDSDGQTNHVPDRERVKNKGVWKVNDGVVIGQQMPDSIAGSYLMSEKKYGDFELTLETNPDYPIDTGIMIRAHKLGSVGFQVLVDNRPNGTIGGVFGNSVGMFFAYPFVFDADELPGNRIANIRQGQPNELKFPGGHFRTDYAASLDEFLDVWKPNDWNEIKIRCTGRLPLIETWINGVPIAKIDTAQLSDRVPDYDADAIFERIGREGHIGLEVHDSPTRDRWAPGAECRWRNVRIVELEVAGDVEERGGPVNVGQTEVPSVAKSAPDGFRSLFDGETLKGWKPMARLPVSQYPGAPLKWRPKGEALEKAKENTGRWTVVDGAIVGGQDPPGSGKGAYLVTEEIFGDFELMMDMKPDWKTDSGFLVRTRPGGSPGMQVLVDHRPQGGIGGFYGNGIAGVHGMPFAIDAEYDQRGNPIKMISADPNDDRIELNPKTHEILNYAADVGDFLDVWKFGEWNTVKVRCVGRIPKLTTWVNGLKIAELDMNEVEWENYDVEACATLLGPKGHISLEVHNNNFKHWLGKDRWWPGAVVRWKNIFIREL